MADRFSRDDVLELARLCNVALSEDEIEAFRDQLVEIEAWLDRLRSDAVQASVGQSLCIAVGRRGLAPSTRSPLPAPPPTPAAHQPPATLATTADGTTPIVETRIGGRLWSNRSL